MNIKNLLYEDIGILMFDRVRQEFHSPITVLWFTGWMSSDASVAWQVSLTTHSGSSSLLQPWPVQCWRKCADSSAHQKWCAPGYWWDHMTNLSQWGVGRNAVWLLIRGHGKPICDSTVSLMDLSRDGRVHQPRSLGGAVEQRTRSLLVPCGQLHDSETLFCS